MTERVFEIGKVRVTEVKTPGGDLQYLADAGPEGKVLVMDTHTIPLSVYAVCIAMALNPAHTEPRKPGLAQHFDPTGFRY